MAAEQPDVSTTGEIRALYLTLSPDERVELRARLASNEVAQAIFDLCDAEHASCALDWLGGIGYVRDI
ncbi:MAG: hypothetical protein ACHREM_04710 [Polyangiales bacterium]